jgi:DNA-binding transcriptional LysR family regulator
MTMPDLNLLIALDALLAEESVARAAKRLRLSPSAMSRTLARLREVMGDPLLVRAGRGLVPSPRALALKAEVRDIVHTAETILRPVEALDLGHLTRSFTLRAREGFAETFGPALIARIDAEAPGVRLRFVPKLDKDSSPLRDGSVDLETGILDGSIGPEIRAQALFQDRFVGVVRAQHPLGEGVMTAARYAAGRHIAVSRRGLAKGGIDAILARLGLERAIKISVGSFSAALALARASDLIATVPARHTAALQAGMYPFPLPLDVPEITISLLWHPRHEADPGHRWLRGCVREVCGAGANG